MTTGPTVHDEAADNSDDSPGDGVQGDHAGQQECEHHERSAALTLAVKPCNDHSGNSDQERSSEQHSPGLREPEPVTEPAPIASKSRHV